MAHNNYGSAVCIIKDLKINMYVYKQGTVEQIRAEMLGAAVHSMYKSQTKAFVPYTLANSNLPYIAIDYFNSLTSQWEYHSTDDDGN